MNPLEDQREKETLIEISLPIRPGMLLWPGDPPFSTETILSVDKGDPFTLSYLRMGSHTGTHIDAPRHFFSKGKGIDEIELYLLLGLCEVWDLSLIEGPLEACHLKALAKKPPPRLLLRTRNSEENLLFAGGFTEHYVGLGLSGAQWLLDQGVRLVGIDYLSIEPYHQKDFATHRLLLEREVVILEGLNLTQVSEGAYELLCLPLKIADADGAPVRAVLIPRGR